MLAHAKTLRQNLKKAVSFDSAPVHQRGALVVVLQTDAIADAVEKYWCGGWFEGFGIVIGHSWFVLTI